MEWNKREKRGQLRKFDPPLCFDPLLLLDLLLDAFACSLCANSLNGTRTIVVYSSGYLGSAAGALLSWKP
jgi:hypothetical protein